MTPKKDKTFKYNMIGFYNGLPINKGMSITIAEEDQTGSDDGDKALADEMLIQQEEIHFPANLGYVYSGCEFLGQE